ncbi:SOS response-associated peptidase [Mucilaginibacter sp. PAMB04274]|uniref:SOS response-associated peptidase n=1 Tax=Mucilaginibacter sp. PAMB04274 TaxID=3138568 RepID=UPI0031F68625
MCYHYALTADKVEISTRYALEDEETIELMNDYDIVYHNDGFAHRAMPVITADEPHKIQLYDWGLIPHWFKPKEGAVDAQGNKMTALQQARAFSNQTLNAIGETVFDKPSFRNYIGQKRCLVPANGIFEWHHLDKKTKMPHYIYLKSREIFSFGGIYSHWVDPETGEIVRTYAILTNPANSLMSRIHNSKLRQPFILPRESEGTWIDYDLAKENVKELIRPLGDEHFTAHTISKLITSRYESSNSPEVMAPYDYEGFQSLLDAS